MNEATEVFNPRAFVIEESGTTKCLNPEPNRGVCEEIVYKTDFIKNTVDKVVFEKTVKDMVKNNIIPPKFSLVLLFAAGIQSNF